MTRRCALDLVLRVRSLGDRQAGREASCRCRAAPRAAPHSRDTDTGEEAASHALRCAHTGEGTKTRAAAPAHHFYCATTPRGAGEGLAVVTGAVVETRTGYAARCASRARRWWKTRDGSEDGRGGGRCFDLRRGA